MGNLQVEQIEHPEFLEYVLSGNDHTRAEWEALIYRIQEEAERTQIWRVLVDGHMLEKLYDDLSRYHLSKLAASVFSTELKVGSLFRQELINYFGETVAVNRGVNLRVDSDRDALMTWLLLPK